MDTLKIKTDHSSMNIEQDLEAEFNLGIAFLNKFANFFSKASNLRSLSIIQIEKQIIDAKVVLGSLVNNQYFHLMYLNNEVLF